MSQLSIGQTARVARFESSRSREYTGALLVQAAHSTLFWFLVCERALSREPVKVRKKLFAKKKQCDSCFVMEIEKFEEYASIFWQK